MTVDEAEKDKFLAPPAGDEEQQANQNGLLDKKHVTKCGLLKVLLIKDSLESSMLYSICFISTSSLTLFFRSSPSGSWRLK